jgi:hypothetical protein
MENDSLLLGDKRYWDREWVDIFDYYQQDIRHAYYIRALKRSNEKKLLEIGAGSFRDMAALCRWGIFCEGVDYSTESIERAKLQFPEFKDRIHRMDAFNFEYGDNSFDLTFHNGFWGCLSSDEEIIRVAKEQARVSKCRMIATVHNAHNIKFKQYFDERKKTDPLYSVRFFKIEEITALMHKVCPRVTIIPVGKGKKSHEDTLIKLGLGHPLILKLYFKLCGNKLLEQSERLLCIGEF